MPLYIAAIHQAGGKEHKHIQEVIWANSKFKGGKSSTAAMVNTIRGHPGQVRVSDGTTTADVHVVEVDPPFIRTKADGKWTDNLLALPKY